MRIRLVSHASVVIESSDTRIWTDPWLFGKAFNDSWALFPPAEFDDSMLDGIEYVWISHEHPDHFHIPTLRSLAPSFKERVTLLFQENNSDKMSGAFGMLGFANVRVLPHRALVPLTEATSVYCYQDGLMDSALAVKADGETVLNVNDAELNSKDCRILLRDIGDVDVVLNQFSIAGYGGYEDRDLRLPAMARGVLDNVSNNHRDLKAKATVPFASYVYFCSEDNRYVNAYANSPRDVHEHLAARGQTAAVLYPGDTYDTAQAYDSTPALERYDALYATLDRQPYDPVDTVPLPKVAEAFGAMSRLLRERYPAVMLRMLRPVSVRIPDLNATASFSIARGSFEVTAAGEADLVVRSQPLHFAFANPYGVQTLGVSARFTIRRNHLNWRLHRILFALNNAELYLGPTHFLTRRNLRWFRERWRGGMNQLMRKLQLG